MKYKEKKKSKWLKEMLLLAESMNITHQLIANMQKKRSRTLIN